MARDDSIGKAFTAPDPLCICIAQIESLNLRRLNIWSFFADINCKKGLSILFATVTAKAILVKPMSYLTRYTLILCYINYII